MVIINLAPGLISMKYGAKGPNLSVCSACATGTHSIGDAYRIIQRGDADAMIAGGYRIDGHPHGNSWLQRYESPLYPQRRS